MKRASRTWSAALSSLIVLASACTAAIDLEPLEDGTCVEGLKACEATCVPLDDRRFGCASPGCTPCFLDNATEVCGPAGECTIATCDRSFADCDGRRENGCEIDIDHDPDHCGRCERACALSNAEPLCTGGRCVIAVCGPNHADCDERADNGCESDLRDVAHCGDCETACAPAQRCSGGACVD